MSSQYSLNAITTLAECPNGNLTVSTPPDVRNTDSLSLLVLKMGQVWVFEAECPSKDLAFPNKLEKLPTMIVIGPRGKIPVSSIAQVKIGMSTICPSLTELVKQRMSQTNIEACEKTSL